MLEDSKLSGSDPSDEASENEPDLLDINLDEKASRRGGVSDDGEIPSRESR